MTSHAQRLRTPERIWRRGVGGAGPLRIAMIGQKGVPARFGGVERHVEEIGARLAALGDDVTVYCRPNYCDGLADTGAATYRGMRLHTLPTLGTKHLDTITHSAWSTLAAMRDRPDIVHYHALGPGLVAPIPRWLSPARVVLTVHGLDNERAKWGMVARAVLGAGHWMSARVPDATVVVSHALAHHYAGHFGRDVAYIPNGVTTPTPRPPGAITARYGLGTGSYLLFVGRLVPEKAVDLLIRAYRGVPGDRRLVIAGDSSFSDEYVTMLRRLAQDDPRVLFVGYAYGELLAELYSNAAAFVLPSYLEGMALTLLEAVSYGVPVVASDIAPNRELGPDRPGYRLFPTGDEDALRRALCRVTADGGRERDAAGRLRERVLAEYQWDAAARSTHDLYRSLVQDAARLPRRPVTTAAGQRLG